MFNNDSFKLSKIRRSILKSTLTLAAGAALAISPLTSINAVAKVGYAEKEELKFGFIKLTDMAPLAVAYEKGVF